MHKRTFLHAGAAFALAVAAPAFAQGVGNYPDKPIRIVVPYPPGGFNDTLARTLGAKLQAAWGQPVVVDNKPGGATVIGLDAAAKSAPDGYTLVILPFSFAVNPAIFAKLPYDSQKDFAPITLAATTANLLVVPATSPIQSMKELLAQAKARPGSLNYASTGIGSSNHLSMELFKQLAGVSITHVPNKGSAPAVTDLIGGQVGARAGRTDGPRGRPARLRGRRLVRRRGARRHAQAHRRQAQCRDRQDPAHARRQGEVRRPGRRAGRQHGRAVPGPSAGAAEHVGQGREGRGRHAGVNARSAMPLAWRCPGARLVRRRLRRRRAAALSPSCTSRHGS